MKITPQVHALLPLHRDGHRHIASKDGGTPIEVNSGFIGVATANGLESLIVTAVNSHEALVDALVELLASAIDASPVDPLRFTRACSGATSTLLLAGAV